MPSAGAEWVDFRLHHQVHRIPHRHVIVADLDSCKQPPLLNRRKREGKIDGLAGFSFFHFQSAHAFGWFWVDKIARRWCKRFDYALVSLSNLNVSRVESCFFRIMAWVATKGFEGGILRKITRDLVTCGGKDQLRLVLDIWTLDGQMRLN